MIFDLTVARLEREDADLGTVGQSIWKAVAAVDVFYVDEIADATGLCLTMRARIRSGVRQRRGKDSYSKQIHLKQRVGERFPMRRYETASTLRIRARARAGFFNSCSQMRRTRQPFFRSVRVTRRSRV